MRISFWSFALLPALASSGCWFFSPTGLDGTVEALTRADCHFAFACCTPPERQSFFARNFRDEGTCVSESLEQGSGGNVVVDRAKAVIAAGNGEFQQERADECLKPTLDALNNCDADAVLGAGAANDPVCAAEQARGFVAGSIDDGDGCNDDIECADFGVCDRSDNDPDVVTTEGECRAAKPEGEDCLNPDGGFFACFPGTFCTPDANGDFTCEEFELKGDGEACDVDSECESGSCDGGEEVFACFFDGAPCTEATEAIDCDVAIGDSCEATFSSVCAANDLSVEVCDGP